MKVKVMYHSSTGNTKKVAEAVALAAGASAEPIGGGTLGEPVDLLFVGDGIYAGKMSRKTKAFISTLDSTMVKSAAVFGTYGGQDKAIAAMAALLKEQGIAVCSEHFACKGQSWRIANKNHPNQEDLDNAASFGRNVIQAVQGK